jgi:hypothetical protein
MEWDGKGGEGGMKGRGRERKGREGKGREGKGRGGKKDAQTYAQIF